MDILLQIAAFLFAVFLLVLIHEYGHFLAARIFHVKIQRFSIGFGKPFYKWCSKKSAIEFCLAPILIGGYVRLLDSREQHVAAEELPFAFDHKPLLQRAAIIFAGPFANILFAFIAFWLIFVVGITVPKPIIGQIEPHSIADIAGMHAKEEIVAVDNIATPSWKDVLVAAFVRIGDKTNLQIATHAAAQSVKRPQAYTLDLAQWKINQLRPDPLQDFGITPYHPIAPPVIGAILKGSPAITAGLLNGDKILAINDFSPKNWDDVIDYIRDHPEQQLVLRILRDRQHLAITVITDWKLGPGWKKIGFLGMQSIPMEWPNNTFSVQKFSVFTAYAPALHDMWLLTKLNGIVLAKLVQGKISLRILGGPIAIYQASSQAFEQGSVMFVGFLALISLALALINLFPIPGVDGGFIIFLLIEAIIGRPISFRAQVLILRMGMIILLVLFLQAMANDLMRAF
jgi:regulator of sigma E protease